MFDVQYVDCSDQAEFDTKVTGLIEKEPLGDDILVVL
jgi:hypothetical protein